jgi:sugar phosphate isomerase/epimerase
MCKCEIEKNKLLNGVMALKTLPVGIQLYSLRDMLEETPQNFASVMQQLRDYGYDGVELAGDYGLAPEYIRDTLDEIGLTPVSAHVPLLSLMDNAQKAADEYATIGCRYLVVPYLPEEYRHFSSGYEKVLSEIERIGNEMRQSGLQLLYHNHDFEFVKLPDGSNGFDDIYRRVSPDVLAAEPDTCWIKVAGFDPVEVVKKYTGRCPIIHLKDFIKEGNPKGMYKLIGIENEAEEAGSGIFEFQPVGFGQQIWLPILAASVQSGAQWVVVEQDEHYGIPSIECARRSREYLRILGW